MERVREHWQLWITHILVSRSFRCLHERAGAALTPPPTGAAYPTLTLPAGPQGAPGVAGPTGPPGPPGPATGLQTQTGTPITSLLPGMGMELVTVEGVCTINLVVPS